MMFSCISVVFSVASRGRGLPGVVQDVAIGLLPTARMEEERYEEAGGPLLILVGPSLAWLSCRSCNQLGRMTCSHVGTVERRRCILCLRSVNFL